MNRDARRGGRTRHDVLRAIATSIAAIERPHPVRVASDGVDAAGVFLHREELREWFDFSIFVKASFDVTVPRAVGRDVASMGGKEAVLRRYAARYVPGQRLYLDQVRPEQLASIVVDNNDYEQPFIVSTPRADRET